MTPPRCATMLASDLLLYQTRFSFRPRFRRPMATLPTRLPRDTRRFDRRWAADRKIDTELQPVARSPSADHRYLKIETS